MAWRGDASKVTRATEQKAADRQTGVSNATKPKAKPPLVPVEANDASAASLPTLGNPLVGFVSRSQGLVVSVKVFCTFFVGILLVFFDEKSLIYCDLQLDLKESCLSL